MPVNMILFRKFSIADISSVLGTYGQDLLIGKFGVLMFLAFAWMFWSWTTTGISWPSLIYSVMIIIFLCSKKKVIRSYALRVITMMQNGYTFWYRTVIQYPRHAVRSLLTSFVFVIEFAISIFISISDPKPAHIGFDNILVEPIEDWNRFSHSNNYNMAVTMLQGETYGSR